MFSVYDYYILVIKYQCNYIYASWVCLPGLLFLLL